MGKMTKDVRASRTDIPFWGRFHYSRAEMIADGVVHAVGIVLAIAAGSALLSLSAFHAGPGEYVAAIFYVVSLLTVLSISLAYNLWPLTPAKWMLRRFDHAAIYLLIAATYTPFLAQLDDAAVTGTMIAVVWGAAVAGMAIKLFLPGRFDRLAIVFYLAIGWSGIVVIRPLLDTLPPRDARADPCRRHRLLVRGRVLHLAGAAFSERALARFRRHRRGPALRRRHRLPRRCPLLTGGQP